MAGTAELIALQASIANLSPSARLRLAAALMEVKRPVLAHSIAESVMLEVGATLALAADDPRRKNGGRPRDRAGWWFPRR